MGNVMNQVPRESLECDLLIVGSGAGGLATAVTAAELGLRVIVTEKESRIGGTTAWSGGWLWVPCNPLARAYRPGQDDREAARTYLKSELGDRYDPALIETFLANGPRMVEFFQQRTEVQFVNGATLPDFHGHAPGAAAGNRAVCAAPFDARKLGLHVRLLQEPLDLFSPMGMSVTSAELGHFYNVLRKPASFLHVSRRVARHLLDLLRYGRSMRIGNGNALAARLFKSALDRGVQFLTSAPAQSLIQDDQGVQGAIVSLEGREVEIRARRGVVLACGGFPHDAQRVAVMVPRAATGTHWSAAPRSNVGHGLRLGESAGGYVRIDLKAAGGWAPVSLVPKEDGSFAHFPHLGLDRAKPGCIMVGTDARRFTNEADSYHDVMSALFDRTPEGEVPCAWLVCDHKALRRWGLGRVRPAPIPFGRWIKNGYLVKGASLEDLASQCKLDPRALRNTVENFNDDARGGTDTEFLRGSTPFNRAYGDPECLPNPCLAPLTNAPFYAVRIVPGSLSTFAGLATDPCGRVLSREGKPIPNLYAAGNDMSSIAGGIYPAGGFTLGPAMTFGYLIGRHAAGVYEEISAAS